MNTIDTKLFLVEQKVALYFLILIFYYKWSYCSVCTTLETSIQGYDHIAGVQTSNNIYVCNMQEQGYELVWCLYDDVFVDVTWSFRDMI